MLRGLDHPGIVRYHEHFVHEDQLCVVMHYCEGGDLSQHIKNRAKHEKHFAEHEAIDLFVQIVMVRALPLMRTPSRLHAPALFLTRRPRAATQALHYVHGKRILHRDLKTQNIFISRGRDGQMGLVKLGDFGIAKVLEGSYAAASTVIGTPYYMSPEVCQGQPYGYMSDVWALGCILYEICALQQAWNGSNLLGLVYKIVQEKQPPLPDFYSEDLKSLVNNMLSKDPAQRPSLAQILTLKLIRNRMQTLFQEPAAAATARPSGIAQPPTGGQPPPQQLAAAARVPSAPPSLGSQRAASGSSSPGPPQGGPPQGAIPTPSQRGGRPPQAQMPPNMMSAAATKPSLLPVRSSKPGPITGGPNGGPPQQRAFTDSPPPYSQQQQALPPYQQQAASSSNNGAARSDGFAGGYNAGGGNRFADGLQPPIPSEQPSPALTPSQQRMQRKLAEADRRSMELKQAAEKSVGQNKELAARMAQKHFSSNLSNGMVERSPSDKQMQMQQAQMRQTLSRESAAALSREAGMMGASSNSGMDRGDTPPSFDETPVGVVTQHFNSAIGISARAGASGYGGGGGGAYEMGNTLRRDVGKYDDDFEDDEIAEEMGVDAGDVDGTLRLAREQAGARDEAHAEAHQRRLAALARAHLGSAPPVEVPPPRGSSASPARPVASQPQPNLSAVRQQALHERCRQALGDLFPPVYEYLRQARQSNTENKEVNRNLMGIVGRDRLNDCMCVDELIFIELEHGAA